MARKAAQNGGKYGFFRFLRVLLLLLLTGFVILTITNPHYVLDKVESIQAEQHDESVAKRIQVDADIRLMLRKLLYALDADRTWLIELHNGSKNLSSGLPFLYGDMRIEEVADGINNVDDEYTDFQISKYPLSGKSLTTDFIGELSKRSRRSTNECISSSSRIT